MRKTGIWAVVCAAAKTSVSINVTGQSAAAYAATLKRNLELTGCFVVRGDGAVKVTGTVGGSVTARGAGKIVTAPAPATDDKSARMAARRMSDAMCEAMSKDGQKGFACDRVIFVSRKTPRSSELCMCYPDGQDVRELTRDGKAAVGPRWKDANTVYYIGYLNGGQQIFEHNVETGARRVAFNLKGISSPAAVSPDGTKVAIAASFQGNPELYVLSGGRYTRLTNTKTASRMSPTRRATRRSTSSTSRRRRGAALPRRARRTSIPTGARTAGSRTSRSAAGSARSRLWTRRPATRPRSSSPRPAAGSIRRGRATDATWSPGATRRSSS